MKAREAQGGVRLPQEGVAGHFLVKASARCIMLLASVSSFSLIASSARADDTTTQPAGEVKTFTPDHNGMVPYIDPITDDGNTPVSVVQDGPGTTVLASANTYTGSTTIKQGLLALVQEGSIATSSGVVMSGGGNFDVSTANGPVNLKSLSGDYPANGTVHLGPNDLNITSAGDNDILYANIVGNGGTITVSGLKEGFGGNIQGKLNLVTYVGTVDVYNEADYTGQTTVKNGSQMHIYGNVPNTSAVTVEAGGLLNGTGTIGSRGSKTNIQTTGRIESGYPGNPWDDLKIGGDLNVDGTSDFTQTTSNHGGIIKVAGDLRLNGTILAMASSGQYGSGVRGLYTYGGIVQEGDQASLVISENAQGVVDTLQVGKHQVNLVEVGQGDNLSFWDGTHTTATNQVEGGSGVWKQGDSTQTNWTTADGKTNGAWNPNSYAVFEHSIASDANHGAITVAGTVNVGGMQFAPTHNEGETSSYYLVPNDQQARLVLNGQQYNSSGFDVTNQGTIDDAQNEGLIYNKSGSASIIRVGDGSIAGAGETVDISTNITDNPSNSTTLVKTDLGTLILSRDNSYTGGTVVKNGVLQIASDNSLGASNTALDIDGGTVRLGADIITNRTVILGSSNYAGVDLNGHTYAVNSPIVGPGKTIRIWSSQAILSSMNLYGANTYTGNTEIDGNWGKGGANVVVNAYDKTPFGTSDDNTKGGSLTVNAGATVNMNGNTQDQSASMGNRDVTLNNNSVLNFNNKSDANTANITLNDSSSLNFNNNSTADKAKVIENGGTLDISHISGAGIAIGSLSGPSGTVSLGGKTLTIGGLNQSDTLGAIIQDGGAGGGTGGLTIAGGTETLTGQNSYTGETVVQNDSTLEVNGAIASTLTDVQKGGTLRGTGTVGTTTVEGTISPGSSSQSGPATLHVNGDLTMAQGSVLQIHGTSDTTGQSLTTAKGPGYNELTSDRLAVTGQAALKGGTLDLIVTNAGEGLTYGQAYRVLTADKGVSGQFNGLNTNLAAQYAYLDPTLAYTADAVDIVLKRNTIGFGDIGETRNQITTGNGLSHVKADSGLITAMTGLTKDQARYALDNLSGEIHASIRTALIQDSVYIRNAVMNRLANADCDYGRNGQSVYDLKTHKKNGACYSDHAVLWGQAYGGLGHNSGDGNAALMHHNTAGFIVGADAPIHHSNWRVGGLLSYGHSQFNVERGRSSSGNSNNITVGAYAGTHWGRLNLRLGADYSWNVISTRRQIAVGSYGSRVHSSYLGGTAQAYAELGYKLHTGRAVFEPFMRVAYVNMQTNSFREHGNEAALRSRGTDQGVTFSTFGFRAATRMTIGKAVFMPHLMAGYRHGFGRLRPGLHEGFVAGGSTSSMDVAGVLLSQNAAVTDAGITAQVTDRIGVDLSYIGQYGNHSIESGATGSVNVSF